ncbi:putative chloroplast RNA binding protein [Citrus sinensis]|uniref:RRM domain-containing protein n=1 Tax=Citrus clementina TaxID=85681 RepID=V4SRY6_CITCL|nr:RNA-binding protein CP29B, chloroplastic [Citrus x clementina]XP_006428431.1 RNA-binding protein CP29B, chloroplastic [Citrus x clementina]XP_024038173.1 RNA-binding protein CP29B, chloroplastic [Citrus x clementina]XP_024038174.1 RNA-binding protein CP29B, chloroplastic [Citrus x clementina]XP_024948527.1 RNA-binding protein CP29B, chloroplastic [Citrus sinensis]ESR41670.1 hypothetical protein CICLE_v10012439mg [Citrus x clementina]ESR41671.1 hypothetical protein CICLE_v10012439mg [Citrus
MAALEAAATSIFLTNYPFSFSCLFPKLPHCIKLLHSSNSTPSLIYNFPTRNVCLQVCSTLQDTTVQTKPEQTQKQNIRRKIYVFNLPWSFSVAEIKNLFAPCGTVVDVEIIKHKGGKNRNFAFVTMASPEEAQAAVNQFDTQEVSGRIIRVEFAKKFKKPRPQRSASAPARETQHKLYVSNLSWKVRSTHLREFFSANFNPVSSKVVFESNEGRSAGYGFVSFATKEEAEAAISSLDGKELMGRPLRLKFGQKNDDVSESNKEEEDVSEDQSAES